MSDRPTQLTELSTVAVPVSDQDRALDFYVGTLGFEKRMDVEFQPGFRWIEVGLPEATTTIALTTPPPDGPVGIDTGIRLRSNDADADFTSLRAAGVDTDPEVLRWPGVPPMFSFADPDGNRLYLVEGD